MEMQKLSQKINEIQMSEEMKERIIHNCYNKMEENVMSKSKTNKFFKKPMVAVASLTLCFCLAGVTALATTGKLQGFFKDIKRWDGAVIGTSYEQATDEINMRVISMSDELTVTAEMVKPNVAPYSVFETMGIGNYKIVNEDGKVVVEGLATEFTEIVEGEATMVIPVSDLGSGNYKLVVSEFVGSAKADQPLVLSGTWVCEFVR